MTGSKYTDIQRQAVLADYIALQNIREVAEKHNIPKSTVISWIEKEKRENSNNYGRLCEQKKEEIATDVLEYLNQQSGKQKSILGKCLDRLDGSVSTMAPKDVATVYGILCDKAAIAAGRSGGVAVKISFAGVGSVEMEKLGK